MYPAVVNGSRARAGSKIHEASGGKPPSIVRRLGLSRVVSGGSPDKALTLQGLAGIDGSLSQFKTRAPKTRDLKSIE